MSNRLAQTFLVLSGLFICLATSIPVKQSEPTKVVKETKATASGNATFEDFKSVKHDIVFTQTDKDAFSQKFDNKGYIKYSSTTDVTNNETGVVYASRVLTAEVDLKGQKDKFTIKSKDANGVNEKSYFNDRKNNVHRINGKLADDKTLDLDIDWDKDLYQMYKSLGVSNDMPIGMTGTESDRYRYFTLNGTAKADDLEGYQYDKIGKKSTVYIFDDKNNLVSISDITVFYIDTVEYQKKVTFQILDLERHKDLKYHA